MKPSSSPPRVVYGEDLIDGWFSMPGFSAAFKDLVDVRLSKSSCGRREVWSQRRLQTFLERWLSCEGRFHNYQFGFCSNNGPLDVFEITAQ